MRRILGAGGSHREEFNRLHGSEATARVLEVRGDEIIIEFSGSFCATCGCTTTSTILNGRPWTSA